MTTAAKKPPHKKTVARVSRSRNPAIPTPAFPVVRRGGKRDGAGRQAPDGATAIITTSIGLMQRHRDWLSAQPGGPSVWIRKMVDAMIERQRKKSEAAG